VNRLASERPGLYGDRAEWYDRIYHWKDYPAEAERLAGFLAEDGVPDGSRVLEVACGTGSFLVPLAARYDVSGLDRSPELLAIAARKLPGVRLARGDMRSFEVDRPYDALLCLFSSIGYVRDESELAATAASFAAALRPGGALLIEPWLDPADFVPGHVSFDVWRGDDLHLARSAFASLRGDVSRVEFRWIAASPGGGVELDDEIHELWLCPRATLQAALEDAGFTVRWDPGSGGPRARGLFRARKRAQGAPRPI
jgi:daunosaminyl-N,N-dimethyltransferase/N-dimethyltransferase